MWRDYRGLNCDEVTWEKRDKQGQWEACDSEDKGAREVKRCSCCGYIYYGSRCDCATSKW